MNNRIYMRGDIYFVERAVSTGCEIRSGRPAVIVSNQMCNEHSPVVEMVYLTTKQKKNLPTHVQVNSSEYPDTALCEQIVSVDKSRLQKYYGRCTQEEMRGIDRALLVSLGLVPVGGPRREQMGQSGPVNGEKGGAPAAFGRLGQCERRGAGAWEGHGPRSAGQGALRAPQLGN